MKNKLRAILVISILAVLLGSCKARDELNNDLYNKMNILSLKNSLELTDTKVAEWEDEAYLVNVRISFGESGTNSIRNIYESPDQKEIAYSVWLFSDGQLNESKFFKYDIDINNRIRTDDWIVDSPEILQISLSSKMVKEFIRIQSHPICGFMKLGKSYFQEHPYSWVVNIGNCSGSLDSINIEIDAKTGKIIEE